MLERKISSISEHSVSRLERLQNATVFADENGLWPSFRHYPFTHPVLDTNIFITSSIVYVLDACLPLAEEPLAERIRAMQARARQEFPRYKNKDGRNSYNYWRTMPSEHFPNGKFLKHFDYLRLPDDIDDTALVGLTGEFPRETAADMAAQIAGFANGKRRTIYRAPKELKTYGAFTTFMGIKTPLEFDVCAQVNALSLYYAFHLELDDAAQATAAYVRRLVKDETILNNPFFASPNYANPAIILYHVARHIFRHPTSVLSETRDALLAQARRIESESEYDQFFLSYTRLLLGKRDDALVEFNAKTSEPFYIAGMLSGFDNALAQTLAPQRVCHVRFYSEALNRALFLHYLLLWKSHG